MVTNISSSDFIAEVKRFGITKDSLIRVRMMKKGEFVYCRFAIPHTNEVLQTIVPLKQFEAFEFVNLSPIAVPAVWDDEIEEIKNLNKKLEEMNANTVSSNQSNRLWSRQLTFE